VITAKRKNEDNRVRSNATKLYAIDGGMTQFTWLQFSEGRRGHLDTVIAVQWSPGDHSVR